MEVHGCGLHLALRTRGHTSCFMSPIWTSLEKLIISLYVRDMRGFDLVVQRQEGPSLSASGRLLHYPPRSSTYRFCGLICDQNHRRESRTTEHRSCSRILPYSVSRDCLVPARLSCLTALYQMASLVPIASHCRYPTAWIGRSHMGALRN